MQRHDPAGLRCEIDGVRHYVGGPIGPRPLVSVTSVLAATSDIELSWGYRMWRAQHEAVAPGLAADALAVAAARGSKLDREVREALTSGREPPPGDVWLESMRPLLRQFRSVARLVLADAVVWSLADGVAGTIDLLLSIAGQLWLLDVKTSAKPWTQDRIALALAQLGGYARCIEWTYDRKIHGCGFAVALPDQQAQVSISSPRSFTVAEAVSAWDARLERYNGRGGSDARLDRP